jgi:nucleoside-diphosphate-sugar epimerase
MVEKILRDAPDVSRIYLLIRPSKEDSAEERFDREVLGSTVFDRLRRDHGAAFQDRMRQKVVAVSGDLTHDRMGVDPAVYARLTTEVDIVINSAATVVFDEPLDLALNLNTFGPGRVLEFAKACRDATLIHVSTAYVSGQRIGRVPEALMLPDQSAADIIGLNNGNAAYDLDAEIESIQRATSKIEEDSRHPALQEVFRRRVYRDHGRRPITPTRLKLHLEAQRKRWASDRLVAEGMVRAQRLGWHDCYTLTKAMGEQLIYKSHGNLSAAIVRPSIIESSLADPESGWLDGLKVADPLIVHYSKGRLPDFPADPSIVLDVIPVDIVANAIIAAIPRAQRRRELEVYHVASGSENPVTLGRMFDLMHEYFQQNPLQNRRGEPIKVPRWTFPSLQRFRRSYQLKYKIPLTTLRWFIERSPLLPWSPRFKQKVSTLETAVGRLLSLTKIYSPYMHLSCEFETSNTRRLFNDLEVEDRQVFNFDVNRINWQEYIQDIHIPALMRNLARENGRQNDSRREEQRQPEKRDESPEYSLSAR